MIAEFSAAVQSVKVLGDILKAAHELKDSTALITAVNEVQGKLTVAYESVCNSQEKRLALQQRITELEKELNEIKNWKTETERYKLTELSPDVTVFTLKPGMENGEPPHKLCTACMAKGQKGYLNVTNFNISGTYYTCNLCGKEIHDTSHKSSPKPIPVMRPDAW